MSQGVKGTIPGGQFHYQKGNSTVYVPTRSALASGPRGPLVQLVGEERRVMPPQTRRSLRSHTVQTTAPDPDAHGSETVQELSLLGLELGSGDHPTST